MVDKQGMADWEICGLCHGANGISAMPKFPKLAGQKPDYLAREFNRFRHGVRRNDGGQMRGVTTEVAPSAVRGITNYFSALPAPTVDEDAVALARANPEAFERGRQLFFEGGIDVPACAGCHAAPESEAPWIDGQHLDYIQKQLEDYRAGRRTDSVGNMSEIAARLTDQDLFAVTLFVSATRLSRESTGQRKPAHE